MPCSIDAPDTPPFARIKRTWETTEVWKEIESGFVSSIGQINVRLKVQGTFMLRAGGPDTLAISHSYELKLGNTSLSIVRVNEELVPSPLITSVARHFY